MRFDYSIPSGGGQRVCDAGSVSPVTSFGAGVPSGIYLIKERAFPRLDGGPVTGPEAWPRPAAGAAPISAQPRNRIDTFPSRSKKRKLVAVLDQLKALGPAKFRGPGRGSSCRRRATNASRPAPRRTQRRKRLARPKGDDDLRAALRGTEGACL